MSQSSFRRDWITKPIFRMAQHALPRLSDTEREAIEAALANTGGRVSGPTGAAEKLGIPRQTLESRIRSLGINKYRFKSE